jgi:hypothetical protein
MRTRTLLTATTIALTLVALALLGTIALVDWSTLTTGALVLLYVAVAHELSQRIFGDRQQ